MQSSHQQWNSTVLIPRYKDAIITENCHFLFDQCGFSFYKYTLMISAITPRYMAVKGLATSWFCVCFLITVLVEDMAQQKPLINQSNILENTVLLCGSICRKYIIFLSNCFVNLIMKYFTMGGWIKSETVNWKYDIRGQATSGLIMDNCCFRDNHNPVKTFVQLQQLWWEHSEGGAQGAGLFLQRQIFVVKVFIYKWRCLKNKPADSPSTTANYISVCSDEHYSAKSNWPKNQWSGNTEPFIMSIL